ncbi:GH3 family domain-containing protein [Salibacter halophilus]|uniref:GH3 auxin-responsive promoter family protein n=1 Tax=Salibacter halophilus TaxID=1803916 RepID=A0A6N6M948_9FLAO|nr:GH3 auxin-responsive promoter family protein [Salibacter halophilus]KAB1063656.1 GH3 auxin-responsive promoter family protein [Salibacter halophilus]
MGIKGTLSKPYAHLISNALKRDAKRGVDLQHKIMRSLVTKARKTAFGSDHDFANIETHTDFKNRVPIHDYEGHKPYIDRIIKGENDVLWPGKPAYFCKTSGTTSGAKYIPLTKDSVPYHVNAAKNALLSYIAETGNSSFLDGKMIFLQGSPELEKIGDIPLGRLSGITAHWVPNYLQKNRMPTWKTNCIDDWETKVDKVIKETRVEDMRLISGIPSWVQMYFEQLLEKTGANNVKEVFPNFSLFVYGGLNYAPYKPVFDKLIGEDIDSVETYPASEGFIAYQDSQSEPGLRLNINAGMFFEFIPADQFFEENPPRYHLGEVELNKNYAIILSTNAGLWGYNIGDTVKFVSLDPYRIVVTGRIKHFISAFGEHVIAEEVESSLEEVIAHFDAQVKEFHLAPQINPEDGLPYHEWFFEFDDEPHNLDAFRLKLDKALQDRNPYYKDLIQGNILRPLVISRVEKGGFNEMMKKRGKLGGQNKIPRLSDNRELADLMKPFLK